MRHALGILFYLLLLTATPASTSEFVSTVSPSAPVPAAEPSPTISALPAADPVQPAAPAVRPIGDYRLNFGDRLVISVFKQPDLQFIGVIPPSGRIMFPMLGSLQLQGRTGEEISAVITAQLKENEFVTNPFVTVQVTDLAPMYVYVRGAVQKPAAVQLPVGHALRVTQLLAAAGGVLEGQAVKEKVQLIHYNDDGVSVQQTEINLTSLEAQYDFSRDPALQNGDEVFVPPKLPPRIIVIGAVALPQTVEIPEGRRVTLSEAIAKCGGLSEKADSASVQLQLAAAPTNGMLKVDLDKVLSGDITDIELADGDRVYIPTVDGIVVSGRVKEPGVVYARPGVTMTVTRALSMSGGFISYASRNEVYVIKKGSIKPLRVDVGNILKTGDLTDDMELNPGDVVIVPEGIW